MPGSAFPEVGVPAGRYFSSYLGFWSHFGSFAPGFLHVHGLICGPAKTGPPIGWFVTHSRAARPLRTRAVSVLLPTRRPLTSPDIVRALVRWSCFVLFFFPT